MKKTVLALVVAAATGVALSAQAPAQPSSQAPAKQTAAKSTKSKSSAPETTATKAPAKAKSHVETAEVVSTDANAKSITVKPKTGDNETYTATGAAVKELANVKAGEQVKLTVHDNDVTSIRAAKPASSTSSKKSSSKKTMK